MYDEKKLTRTLSVLHFVIQLRQLNKQLLHYNQHSTWVHPCVFGVVSVAHLCKFLWCPIICFYVLSSVKIHAWERCSVRYYHQLFVAGLMSYLGYLCLFTYSDVQHILCCVFDLFVFVSSTLCCKFLWIVHFLLSLRYSLTFIV